MRAFENRRRQEIKYMATTTADARVSSANGNYALGYTNSEHERLIRQGTRIEPYTERLFREAGVGPGQRVLDLGSGVGDVSILLARIVGPSGEVVGIERDGHSIARANARVAEAGLPNISFTQADVNEVDSDHPFDAAVGRFILMFLPDPASVLRSLTRLVRPGGVLAFQEPSWIPLLAFGAHVPLWSKLLTSIHETFLHSGVNPEMGPDLYRIFQEIGLPAPAMHMETPLGSDPTFTGLICGLISSVQPLAQQHNVSLDALGNLDTLPDRIHAEVAASNTVVSFVPLVGVWARKATNT
jgi:ubiquinone/menaquinone biosynthesis C-methylase UbiE